MTDDPYLAAAEAFLGEWWSVELTLEQADLQQRLYADSTALRAAVDAVRQPLLDQNQALTDRIAELEATVERVRSLHAIEPGTTHMLTGAQWCHHCDDVWPCGTVAALDGRDSADADD